MATEKYKTLIVKQLLGEITAAEAQELTAWREASADNEKVYEDFARIWRSAPASEAAPVPDLDQEWQQVARKLDFKTQTGAWVVRMRQRQQSVSDSWFRQSRYWAAAAAIFLVLVAGSLLFRQLRTPGLTTVAAAAGEQQQVELPDGTMVKLNSVSQIALAPDLSGAERLVRLEGEAFFEVARDGRPFLVQTQNAQVQVLGTAFNVRARGQETQVVVREGRVALTPRTATQQIELSANQMAVCQQNRISQPPVAVDAEQELGWLRGKLVFSKTPLAEVVAELQRRYDARIAIADRDLRQETLTATFAQKPLPEVLASISLAMNLQVTGAEAAYTLSKKR